MFERFTHEERDGTILHIPGLYYRFQNRTQDCGHIRFFGKPLRGWSPYHWNKMSADWAKSRVWYFGLVTIVHIDAGPDGTLKHCSKPGWHFRFAKIKVKRIFSGWQVQFLTADRGYSA